MLHIPGVSTPSPAPSPVDYEAEPSARITPVPHTIVLRKGEVGSANAKILGFGYNFFCDAFTVTSIVSGSAVEEWNEKCEPRCALCVGDEIVAVNGQHNARDMVKELYAAECVRLEVIGVGPRWHLSGKVAEGLGRISIAIEKNLQNVEIINNPEDSTAAEVVDTKEIDLVAWGLILASCLLPNLALLLCFSDVGFGLHIYSKMAPAAFNSMGTCLLGLAIIFAMTLYVVDWREWQSALHKGGTLMFSLYMMVLGAVMKCVRYPAFPPAIALFHVPVLLGVLRKVMLKGLMRRSFYRAATICLFSTAALILAIFLLWVVADSGWWSDATKARLAVESKEIYDETMVTINGRERPLNFDWDCNEKTMQLYDFEQVSPEDGSAAVPVATGYMLTSAEVSDRSGLCSVVKTAWFLVWMGPLIAIGTNLVLAIFCAINSGILDSFVSSSGHEIETTLRHFILLICSIGVLMYGVASIAGSSMSLTSAFLALCVASVAALLIWIHIEIGGTAIRAALRSSPCTLRLLEWASHDYVRAVAVLCFAGLVPFACLVELCHQQVRKVRGSTVSKLLFTPNLYMFSDALQSWRWSFILKYVNYLCIIHFIFMVGVTKITYVFLSWLNEALSAVPLVMVCILFFLIGFTMFMLPPVPGFPVYITGGIVISSRARGSPGFWFGMAMAVVFGLCVKLVACSGQYSIGYYMGKSTRVQHFIGIDTVLMRAVEKILQVPGLKLPKVCILVGGPDWPTSVICGILKLSLPQILWGTVPVLAISTPCVLAGALLAGGPDGADADPLARSSWETMAMSVSALAFLAQAASGVVAMYFIQKTVAKDFDELSAPRPEHDAVRALRQHESSFIEAYEKATAWCRLGAWHRCVLVAPTAMFNFSFYIFQFADSYLFRAFRVNSRIDADFADGGLEGNVMNIVIAPAGYFPLLIFSLACVMHCITQNAMTKLAHVEMERIASQGGCSRIDDPAKPCVLLGSAVALPAEALGEPIKKTETGTQQAAVLEELAGLVDGAAVGIPGSFRTSSAVAISNVVFYDATPENERIAA